MRIPIARRLLFLSALLALTSLFGGNSATAEDVSTTPHTAEDDSAREARLAQQQAALQRRRDIDRLERQWRAARSDQHKEAPLLDEAESLGVDAVQSLYDIMTKQLALEVRAYGEQFQHQAAGIVRANARTAGPEDIRQQQRTLLTLARNPHLTSEMLQQQAEPALKRLRESLTVESEAVRRASDPLEAMRRSLVQRATHWERAALFLYHHTPEDERTSDTPPSFEQYLANEERKVAESVMLMSDAARMVFASNADLARRMDPEEARCVYELNVVRVLAGLPPLGIDLRLVAAARGHSEDMKTHGFVGHESPVKGKATWADRARLCGTEASGENVYAGSTVGISAHSAWLHSPAHFRNMLADHRRVGVGRFDDHFTQVFGR